MKVRGFVVLGISALMALVAWPLLGSGNGAGAASPIAAPVSPDYRYRDKTISFYEKRVRRDPVDQISARLLAQQYMQRFRESGDIDDVKRSMTQARRSIALQPQNEAFGYEVLASGETALHLFREALAHERFAAIEQNADANAPAQIASLEMELGRYGDARRVLLETSKVFPNDTGVMAVRARYDELTGNAADAERSLQRGANAMDSNYDNSAQARAWFHFRLGELAFMNGDAEKAKLAERDALAIFPNYATAYNALARFCWATKDWTCTLDSATKGANVVPLPETLGYKADAQRALGDADGAAQTDALIQAIERVGNAYRVSDRLLAVYYSEHHLYPNDAYRIARREIAVRGDEIYAQDTLAWAAAMDGHWNEAGAAIRRAMQFGTQDARLYYHAGIIALHFHHRKQAAALLHRALELNAQFHPIYADDARLQLSKL